MTRVRIVADVVIPGRGEPVDNGTVVLEHGEIVYAGPTSTAPPSTGDEQVREVVAVLPGLWDCHTHFTGIAATNLEKLATSNALSATARATNDAAAVLDGGITSVRDVGGLGIALAPVIAEGRIPGPTIHAAGRILSTTGGHGDIHSLPLDQVHSISCNHNFSILCDGVPEVLRAVRTNLRSNAKLIKVCASGGVMSEVDHPDHQQFSDEELAAIVGEADGLTDLEAIEAATANAPETLGPQAPRSGQLRQGYDADVIALDANPLDDRSVWGNPTRVTHVWQSGNLVKEAG